MTTSRPRCSGEELLQCNPTLSCGGNVPTQFRCACHLRQCMVDFLSSKPRCGQLVANGEFNLLIGSDAWPRNAYHKYWVRHGKNGQRAEPITLAEPEITRLVSIDPNLLPKKLKAKRSVSC
jgi:hypothetical protein